MSLSEQVATLLRTVADDIIMPRYRSLAPHEVIEKSPGELVTSVDRAAEARLYEGLDGLVAGARIVGEEAVALDPALLAGVGNGLVWLVDPLDGTANFARGAGPFGIMVALVSDGEPVAGWLLDAASGRLCHAQRGHGASIDGRRAWVRPTLARRPVAALATQFMAPRERERTHRAAEAHFACVPIPRCAAESYLRLVTGRDDVALFQRILPWDHAAGVLFLCEAGGHAAHWDGSRYRVGSAALGLLAATSEQSWQLAAKVLFAGEEDDTGEVALAA